jgi:membrane dipeptidase
MEKTKQEWSSFQFIKRMTGTGMLMMLNPVWSWAPDDIDPRVAAIVKKTIGVDTHNHIDVPVNTSELPGP